MIKKKNKFLTFIFSLMPGAGQMYMGFMKRGLSLMSAFFLIILISVWLNIGPLLFIALIVWFYSFFDTHNLRSTSDDEFYNLEDNYIIFPDFLEGISKNMPNSKFQKQYINIAAIVLIIIGFTILWNNLFSIFSSILPHRISNFFYSFGYRLPQLVIALGIILLGVHLIKGKKDELDDTEDEKNEVDENITKVDENAIKIEETELTDKDNN